MLTKKNKENEIEHIYLNIANFFLKKLFINYVFYCQILTKQVRVKFTNKLLFFIIIDVEKVLKFITILFILN
uniref:Uncharacterized protein n=1 Tax=Parastrongyloides trichosuri TaxID=131310 RepID=A0A0N5A5I6_PARTI